LYLICAIILSCHQQLGVVGSVNSYAHNEQIANIRLLYTHIQCQLKTERSKDTTFNSSDCQDESKMGHTRAISWQNKNTSWAM